MFVSSFLILRALSFMENKWNGVIDLFEKKQVEQSLKKNVILF